MNSNHSDQTLVKLMQKDELLIILSKNIIYVKSCIYSERHNSQCHNILHQHVDEEDGKDHQQGEIYYDVLNESSKDLLADAKVTGQDV